MTARKQIVEVVKNNFQLKTALVDKKKEDEQYGLKKYCLILPHQLNFLPVFSL